MLRVATFAVLLTVVAGDASSQRSSTPNRRAPAAAAAALETLSGSVVLVRVTDKTGGAVVGNGVVVGTPEQIVTERAILDGAVSISVAAPGSSTPTIATIIVMDTITGIAVLRAPGFQGRPATLARRAAGVNDSVVVITIAPGEAPTLNRTRVRKVDAYAGAPLATLSASIPAEMNGAPVANAAGQLVGIAFVAEVGGVSHTYTIPAPVLPRLLAEAGKPPATAVAVTPPVAPSPARSPTPSAAPPPTRSPAPPAVAPGAAPATSDASPLSFSATGFEYEQTIMAIYAGEFQNVTLKPTELAFDLMFGEYIEACAVRCAASLPPNKVELTTQVCTTERRTVNGYGTVVSSSCVAWETRGRGLYADPVLYAARHRHSANTIGDSFREIMQSAMSANPIAAASNMLATKARVQKDMNLLLQRNGCTSPGTKRFQDNLRLYAIGESPMRLGGAEGAAIAASTRPVSGSMITNANFRKLLEDLVVDLSSTWLMNRYVPGTVSQVYVSARDSAGRPTEVTGGYAFNGMKEHSPGSLVVRFTNGLPVCVFFYDAPQTCRTPSAKIVSTYASGGYPPSQP